MSVTVLAPRTLRERVAKKLHVPAAALESWPLPADLLISGRPQARGVILSTSEDGRCTRGIWACTPGAFRWTWTEDETVTVVEGRATVVMEDGRRIELVAGDMGVFEAGQSSAWTIHEPFRKSFETVKPDLR